MIHKLKILALLITFPLLLTAQSFNIEWQGCYGGSDTEKSFDIIQIDDGYLITGSTRSNDGDVSYSNGMSDIWLVKISNTGDLLWEKTYGGSKGDGSTRIFEAGEGNFYIIGASNSSDGDVSNDPYPNTWDLWVLKIDSTGSIIWEEIYGGNGDETVWTGTTTEDGGLVALVWTGSNDGDVSNHYGLFDAWMIKVNSEGEKEWDFTLGSPGQDVGQAIIQTSDGGFLVGISTELFEGGNITCTPHSYNSDAVLVKLDANLNIEWDRCYGGSNHDGATALAEVSDGYIMGGYAGSNDGDISGWHGKTDVWVVKVDFDGNILWQKCLGGTNSESTFGLTTGESQSIIVTSVTKSNNGDVTGNHSNSEYDADIWIVKIDGDGELIWQHCFGGIANEELMFGFHYKSENNFVIAGQTDYGPSFDVGCTPHGGNVFDRDFWVFEVKDTTVNVNEVQAIEAIKAYPNPAKDYVVFELPANAPPSVPPGGGKNPTLQITNIFGQEVARLQLHQEITVWDCRKVQSGVYFYRYEMKGVFYSGKIVISK